MKDWRSNNIINRWRKANVASIFREDQTVYPGSYRQINLTFFLGKIVEGTLLELISGHMKEKNSLALLTVKHGVIKAKSFTYDEMTAFLDEVGAVDDVYLDCCKALDSFQ